MARHTAKERYLALTDEQKAIIEHEPIESLIAEAGAGTGKTSVLVQHAQRWPNYRGLYLSFNAEIAKEAKRRFPSNVQAMTAHSYAYRALGVAKHNGRLVGKIRRQHLRDAGIDLRNGYMTEDRTLRAVLAAMINYPNDAGTVLKPSHCLLEGAPQVTRDKMLPFIARILKTFMEYETSGLPFTHDMYLKKLETNGQLAPDYDYLLVDEAQDLSPVLVSLVKKSGKPAIIVGDSAQSIYAFKGAVDALSMFDAKRMPLSQSWRFGAPVDRIANGILAEVSKPPTWPIRGRPGHITSVELYRGIAPAKAMLLSRTNSRLFEGLINTQVQFHVAGGFEVLASQLLSAYALSTGDRWEVKDALIQSFQNWEEMVEEANENDPEIRRLVQIVKTHGREIHKIIDRLRTLHCANAKDATIILSTAHKAKGLEAANVVILDDFQTIDELKASRMVGELSKTEFDQECNLKYVAATRAINRLLVSEPLYSEFMGFMNGSTALAEEQAA